MTLGLTLFFIWLLLWSFERTRPDANLKFRMVAIIVILPFVAYPFVYGPLWWLRGLTGDLSITSTLLLALAIYRKLDGKALLAGKERGLLKWAIAGIGVLFYPLALGLGTVDPYVWGYANTYFVIAVLIISLLLFIREFYIVASLLVIALLAWNMQLLQSHNLWDYLLDPFVFFYFLARVVRCRN